MHRRLISKEHWESFSTYEQLANIGSEVGRAFKWKRFGDKHRAYTASLRAFELFNATTKDIKNTIRKKEINIAKDLFTDLFFDRGEYKETPENLEKYFTDFAILAKNQQL